MDILRTHFQGRGPEFFADIPSYQFKGFLGEGSFGAVYKAVHKSSGEIVAIKINKTEKEKGESSRSWQKRIGTEIADFEREHRVLQKLKDTPNTLQLKAYLSFPGEGRRAIVTNCLDGSLGDMFQRKEITEGIAFKAFRHCLRSVRHLAEHGLAHRDIHPGNIFYGISSHNNRLIFVLGDFGMCSKIGKNDKRGGAMSFRPPEMAEDRPSTPTSDIWSLFASICQVAKVVSLDQNDITNVKNEQALRCIDHPMTRDWMDCFALDWRRRPSAADLLERFKGRDSFRGIDHDDLAVNHNGFVPIDIAPKGKSRYQRVEQEEEREEPARSPRRRESTRAYERADPAEYEQEDLRPRRRESTRRASNMPDFAPKASSHREGCHRPRASSRAPRDSNCLEIAPRDSTRYQELHQPWDDDFVGKYDHCNILDIAPNDSTRYQELHRPRDDAFVGKFDDYNPVEIAPRNSTRWNAMNQRPRASSRAGRSGFDDVQPQNGAYEIFAEPVSYLPRASSRAGRSGFGDVGHKDGLYEISAEPASHRPRASSRVSARSGFGPVVPQGAPYEMAADPAIHQLRNTMGRMDLARTSQPRPQQSHRQPSHRQPELNMHAADEGYAPRGRRSSKSGWAPVAKPKRAPEPSVGRRPSASGRSSVQGRAPVELGERATRLVDDRRSRRSSGKVPGFVAFVLG